MHILTIAVIAFLFVCPLVRSQVTSRAAEIEAARASKAQTLRADTPSGLERGLRYMKDQKVLERISAGVAGFRLKLGGLVSGSGFALGPEYLRRDLWQGRGLFRTAAQSSFKKYQKYDTQFTLHPQRDTRYFLDLGAVHRNYPGINYYGPGPDSSKSFRSNFRLEDTEFNGVAGVRPAPRLQVGGSLSYLLVNVGPGMDERFVSSEQVFSPPQTVGIDQQADFLRHGFFAQYDYRDLPGGPRSGGNYIVEYSNYSDRTLDRHDFRRLDLHLQQFIGFFNDRRVLALRGKSIWTFPDDGQQIPFYLQPTLGGSDDLRGFRPFRFYDDNLILLNAEYRWETFSGLDMALFADAGKVFHEHSQWNLHDLESSVGFGFRFNVRNNVFLRLDVGFSHEGFQVWVKFNNIFSEGLMGASETQAVF